MIELELAAGAVDDYDKTAVTDLGSSVEVKPRAAVVSDRRRVVVPPVTPETLLLADRGEHARRRAHDDVTAERASIARRASIEPAWLDATLRVAKIAAAATDAAIASRP